MVCRSGFGPWLCWAFSYSVSQKAVIGWQPEIGSSQDSAGARSASQFTLWLLGRTKLFWATGPKPLVGCWLEAALGFLLGCLLLHQSKCLGKARENTDFSGGASGKEPACQHRRHKRHGYDPWVRKTSWRGAWQHTPVFMPGEPLDGGAWRALVRRVSESDATKVT